MRNNCRTANSAILLLCSGLSIILVGCGEGGGGSHSTPSKPGTTASEVAFVLVPDDLGAGDSDGVPTSAAVAPVVDLAWAAANPNNLRQWDDTQVGTSVGTRSPCTDCQCVDYVRYRVVGSTRSALDRSGWGGYGNQVQHRISMATNADLGTGDIPRPGAVFHYFLNCNASTLGCSHTGIVESAELLRDGEEGATELYYQVVVAEQNFRVPNVVNDKRMVPLSFPSLESRKLDDFNTTDALGRRWQFVYTPTETENEYDQQAKDLIATWWNNGLLKRALDRGGELSLGEYQRQPLIKTVRLLRTSVQRDVAWAVLDLFQSELGRGADFDGLLLYLPYVAAEETEEQIRQRIRSTEEYLNRQAGQQPPTLALVSTSGAGTEVGQSYILTLAVKDADGDLSRIEVDWGDGSAVSQFDVTGSESSQVAQHSFVSAETFQWSAVAVDAREAISQRISGSITVRVPAATNRPPTVSASSSATTIRLGEVVTISVDAADLDANLSKVTMNWDDGSVAQTRDITGSKSNTSFTKSSSSARTLAWSVSVSDTTALSSKVVSGIIEVRSDMVAALNLTGVSPNPVDAGTTKPYAPSLTLSGTNLNTVTTIKWLEQGTLVSTWTKLGNGSWTSSTGSSPAVTQSAASLGVQPTVVASTDTWSGSRTWTVTVGNGTAEVSSSFSVNRTEPVAALNLTGVSPNPVNAGTTKPYAPSLTLSGTNLNTVTTIKWLEQGTLVSTWTKLGNGSWTSSTGSSPAVTQSAASLGVQPTVVASTDTWSGSRTWTVTVGNGTAEVSSSFSVNRTEPVAALNLTGVSPNPVNAGTTKPYAPSLTLSGTNLNTVTTIKWLEQGTLVSTWTKLGNGSWTSSTGSSPAVTQSAASLGVQPTVVASTDTWSGSRTWTVTVGNGTAEVSSSFSVNRTEPVAALNLTGVSPNPVNAGTTKPYAPSLTLSGTNLNTVTTIKWLEQGTLVSTWTKLGNGSWTSSTGSSPAVTQSAASLGVQPTVVASTDTWSGSRTWTVTVGNGTAEVSSSFSVTRTEPVAALNLTGVSPNPVNAGTTKPYAPSLTLSGTNLNTVTTIKWLEQGTLVSTWTKLGNGSWTSSTGSSPAVTRSAASLGVQPTVVASTDTWSGSRTWTVTVGNGTAEASSSFSVTRRN